MAYIVTGYTGQQHVTSQDDAAFNRVAGIAYYYVKQDDNNESPMITNSGNGVIKLPKMTIIMYGIVCRINGTETVTLDVGSQGMYRTDLIAGKYQQDPVSGVESFSIEVIKGTPTSNSSSTVPSAPKGDVTKGETCYVPLFTVQLNGNNVSSMNRVIGSNLTIAEITAWINNNKLNVGKIGTLITDLNSVKTTATSAKLTAGNVETKLGNLQKQVKTGIVSGTVTVTPSAVGTVKTANIDYGVIFTSPPTVVVSPTTGAPQAVSVSVSAKTETHFTVCLHRSDSKTATGINWIACGEIK